MPRPGARKFIEKRNKSRGRRNLAANLQSLGANLLALQDRKIAIEKQEEEMKLQIQEAARRDKVASTGEGALEVDRGNLEARNRDLDRKDREFAAKENERNQPQTYAPTAGQKQAADFEKDFLGDYNQSPLRPAMMSIFKNLSDAGLKPSDADYAQKFREAAQSELRATVLGDMPLSIQAEQTEKSISWMMDNHEKAGLGITLPPQVRAIILNQQAGGTPDIQMPLVNPGINNPPVGQSTAPAQSSSDEYLRSLGL